MGIIFFMDTIYKVIVGDSEHKTLLGNYYSLTEANKHAQFFISSVKQETSAKHKYFKSDNQWSWVFDEEFVITIVKEQVYNTYTEQKAAQKE